MDGDVRFYDVSGAEVYSTSLKNASTIVNLGRLNSGTYIYRKYDAEEEIFSGQVIVVR